MAKHLWTAIFLTSACALSTPVLADESVVGELVVTAQRRAQDAVDVPAALTAYTGETLTRLRVSDLHDLAAFTPGLVVQDKSAADSRFVLRGIGSDDGSSYQEARVSVFQDGAPISKSRGAFVELFDLERVEVSRGPQTTLYGRSALIGAINLVQRKASFDGPDWSLRGEAGTYGSRLAEGAGNLVLGEDLAMRGAVRYRQRDGHVDDLLGGEAFGGFEVAAGRLAFAWRPDDAVEAQLILNHQHDEATGQPYKSRTFYPADPTTGRRLGDLDPGHGAALSAAPGFVDGPLGLDRDVSSATGLVTWKLDPATTLNLTSAYRRFDSRQILDFDGFAFPLLTVGDRARGEQQSHELRLNYEPGGALTFVGGISILRETGHQITPLQIDERLVLALLTGALDRRNPALQPLSDYTAPALQAQLLRGVAGASGVTLSAAQAAAIAANLRGDHRETYGDYATNQGADIYGDVTWRVTEPLEVSAGLRYGYTEKETSIASSLDSRSVLAGFLGALRQPAATRAGLLTALSRPGASTIPTSAAYPVPMFGLRAQPTANNGDRNSEDLVDRGAAWRLAGRYALTPDAKLYAVYAHGRRPQVLAPNTPSAPGGRATFDRVAAETVDSVEVGLKWRAPAQGLTLDTALYAYDYKHFQTVIQQGVQFVVADAGRARSYGLEMQGGWRFAEGQEVFATYSWTHARFRDGLYRGNHLALSPDHSLTVGLDLHVPAPGGSIQILPTYAYQSQTFFTDDNGKPALATGAFVAPLSFQASQKGYGLLDLRVAYQPDAGHWTAGVFVTNALDQGYIKEAGNGGEDFGLPTYIAGNPRIVGVSVSLKR